MGGGAPAAPGSGLRGTVSRGYVGLLGGLNIISAIFIFILMLLISADVVGRYAFGKPLQGTFEISESLLVFVVFLGLAHTQYHKGNIRVEMVVGWLPRRLRPLLDCLAHTLGLALFALVTWETFRYFLSSWAIREASAGIVHVPLYPARLAVPVGSFFLAFQFALDSVADLRRFVRGR